MPIPRIRTLSITTAVAVAALAPTAVAAGPPTTGRTAPAYPGNTIAIDDPGALVAGATVRLKLRGHAQWNEVPTTDLTTTYGLALYAQDAAVDATCAAGYGAQLQKSINLPGLSAASTSGFVLDGELRISPDVPAPGTDWSAEALPFALRPDVRRVVLCAYQRYVIDDAAYAQRSVRVDPLACAFRGGGAIRRGRAARVRCNFSGDVRVRLTKPGGKARTARARVSSAGSGTLSTRSLTRGRWTASFTVRGLRAGTAKLRVR